MKRLEVEAKGMRTFCGGSARVLAAALALGAAGSSCTDANDSLTILQALVPDDECKIDEAAMTTERLPSGTLDVGLDRVYPYTLYPLVSNNLPVLAAEGSGAEPNRVSLSGAEIKIVTPPGVNITWPADCPGTFSDASNAIIMPGQRGALSVSALRACHAKIIRDLFTTGALPPALSEDIKFRVIVRAQGRHGGTNIHSDPFEFPIRVCFGCLQTGFAGPYAQFSFSYEQPKYIACERLSENPYTGNKCNPAQDRGPILCCAEDPRAEKLSCPGVPQAPAGSPSGVTP